MRLVLATLLLITCQPDVGYAAAETSEAEVEALIEQLGRPTYEDRLDARRRLLAVGLRAFDALRRAQADPDPEVADACGRLLAEMTSDWSRRSDPPVVRQWLGAYDAQLAGRELDVIGALAKVVGEKAYPALVRLARFEPSDLAAAEAARVLIAAPEYEPNAKREQAVAEAVTDLAETYGPGQRPAAQWLSLAAAEAGGAPPAPDDWRRHAEAELARLDGPSGETSGEVVATLTWRWLRAALAAGEDRSAIAAAESLVALDPEEATERLSRCVRWCAAAERWEIVDRLLAAEADRLTGKRGLYLRADLAQRRGDEEEYRRLAALALDADIDEDGASVEDVLIGPRVMVAGELYAGGHTELAIAEYCAAAATDDPLDGQAAVASWRLSNLLFDAERYDEAAVALAPIVEKIDRSRSARAEYEKLPQVQREEPLLVNAGQLISRQRFSEALAARDAGDHSAEMALLQSAINAEPRDADVLIAMHKLHDAPPAFRNATRRRIDEQRRIFERNIWERPGDAEPYNQWAWLVSNTYGDFDKAVRYSQRSLDIEPDTGGYLDTLGRCLFSAGRIEEAIVAQRRAVELEPRMLVLQRQLAEFERALTTNPSKESAE